MTKAAIKKSVPPASDSDDQEVQTFYKIPLHNVTVICQFSRMRMAPLILKQATLKMVSEQWLFQLLECVIFKIKGVQNVGEAIAVICSTILFNFAFCFLLI